MANKANNSRSKETRQKIIESAIRLTNKNKGKKIFNIDIARDTGLDPATVCKHLKKIDLHKEITGHPAKALAASDIWELRKLWIEGSPWAAKYYFLLLHGYNVDSTDNAGGGPSCGNVVKFNFVGNGEK